jgi:CRISPR-associated protein Csm3
MQVMHNPTYNELRLDFSIIPSSPLCITARDTSSFVQTIHPIGGMSVYIPGATLKGTLRRAAEHVVQSAGLDCCEPEHPCAERPSVKQAAERADSPGVYRALCVACRLFGSPVLRSHITVTDSFPVEPVGAEIRRAATEPIEIVTDETFYGTMSLRNFERWQVGLLALLLAGINIADVQIGAHRAEGMGCIVLRYNALTLIYPGLEPSAKQEEALQAHLHGVGQLIGAAGPYGVTYPDISNLPDLPETTLFDRGLGYCATVITAPDPDDSEAEDTAHTLIDNVLTQQAMAWGNYLRTARTAR